VPRVGRILFQFPAQPGDMRVDRAPADCGTGSPDFAEQLHAGCDRTATPHQREKKPELCAGHAYGLSSPQHRLSGRLQKDTAKANRPSQPRSSTGWKAAGSSQQIFHSSDQLAHNRGVRVSRAVQFIRAYAFSWERSGDLKLVNDRAGLFDRIELFDLTGLRGSSGGIRFVSCFILIVDDEDSRNASIVGAARRSPRELW
jgi:hypothetical protein